MRVIWTAEKDGYKFGGQEKIDARETAMEAFRSKLHQWYPGHEITVKERVVPGEVR
ncbi:hypothetical protein [Anaerotalea alkaliphila]|uniref:Uncharacterized protein n=1 Tax=Anaerotalea alkaliphila TaxID=2662126 RepID=A0A7X5HWL3_9FIRM|nr:hypothetical protein [Anaerotalea alkaliphila]NDL68007.1 hypothetical protein [Anaerotalea alkaliphila]